MGLVYVWLIVVVNMVVRYGKTIWLIVMINVVLHIPIPWMVRERLMSTASKKKSIKDLGETNMAKMEEHLLLHPLCN